MNFGGKAFDQLQLGEQFSELAEIDETHLSRGAQLSGDFNPLHVNPDFAANSRFGHCILHGAITAAIMSAPVGNYFAGTAIAMLEQNNRYKEAVMPGDTLKTVWTVDALIEKPKLKGGIAEISAVCRNQRGEVVAESDGKILLASASM